MKLIIIGTGSRGRVYARYAKEYGAQIVAVADPNEERLQDFAAKFSVPKDGLFKSWEDVFKLEKFADAVIISTPDRLHYDPTRQLLKKVIMYYLKPMSPVEQECRDMVINP